jgi:hypothetical protein
MGRVVIEWGESLLNMGRIVIKMGRVVMGRIVILPAVVHFCPLVLCQKKIQILKGPNSLKCDFDLMIIFT